MSLLRFEGVAERTTAAALRAKFEEYGQVQDFNVFKHRDEENALGSGYVKFVRETSAEAALHAMNHREFDGQVIRIIRYGTPSNDKSTFRGISRSINRFLSRRAIGLSGNYSHSRAGRILQPQDPRIITLRWELPLLLQSWLPYASHSVITNLILGAITLVARGQYIEVWNCRQYLDKFYPQKGVKLVEAITKALDSPNHVFESGRQGLVVMADLDQLVIVHQDFLLEIKDIAVWLCLAFRVPRQAKDVMISTGSFDNSVFSTTSLIAHDTSSCWLPLFDKALVVLKPSEVLPEGGLLKLSFGALIQLAAVEYPVMIDSGLILMGYSTALIPIETNNDGLILWHLEVSSGNQQLRKSELRATKGPWLQKQTLEELQAPEALLGWCDSAKIQLGTNSLNAAEVKWSNASVKRTTWHWKGANLQMLAQSAAPLQIGGQLGLSWERSLNTIHFTPRRNYTRCLVNSKLESVVLYDVTAQRAWLVPLLSVYHHMLLIYYEKHFPSRKGNERPIPVAVPASNGAASSFDALSSSGSIVVEGKKKDALTIRDLIMGFSINFSKTDVQAPKKSHIYGYELLDLVMDSSRSELKTITVNRQGLGWAPLLNEVPCLFCAELGEAIVGMRSEKQDSPCNSLPREQDLLASQLATIQVLCNKQGSTFSSVSGQVTQTHTLVLQQGQSFTRCDHSLRGASSCWDHPETFVQKLQKLQRETNETRNGTSVHEVPGAVILGDAKGHILNRATDIWR